MSSSMPPCVPCPELGSGWTLQVIPRRTGKQVDRYWYNSEGRRFRSRAEVDRFLNAEKPAEHSVVQGKYDIGQTISKRFQAEGSDSQRYFSGTITDFDEKRRLYKVVYEDHDEEELSEDEMERLVMVKNQNAPSPLTGIKKRKLNHVSTENPYKKIYRSRDSRQSYKSERNAKTTTVDNGESNHDAKSKKLKQADVKGKSKPKLATRKSRKTASNSVAPKSSQTIDSQTLPNTTSRKAILRNSLPSRLTSPIPTTPSLAAGNTHSLIDIAKRRVESAKRWIASATSSYITSRRNLDSAIQWRIEALNEHTEAKAFYDRVVNSSVSSKSKRTSKRSMNESNNNKSTSRLSAVDEVTVEISSVRAGVDLGVLEKNEHAEKPVFHDESAVDTSKGRREDGNEILDKPAQPQSESSTKLTEPTHDQNNLPLKKRPQLVDSTVANGACFEVNTKTEDSMATESNNYGSEDNEDNSMVQFKPSPPPFEQQQLFSDLLPETEVLQREESLSSIPENDKVDQTLLLRAVDLGLPEQDVLGSTSSAREEIHDVVSDSTNISC